MTDLRFALGGIKASAPSPTCGICFSSSVAEETIFSSMVLVHFFFENQIVAAVWFISMLFILFHWSMQDWALFYALGPCMSYLRSTYFLRQYSSGCFLLFFEFLMLWIYKSLSSWVAGQCFLEFCWLPGNSVDYLHCSAQLFRVLGSQQLGFAFVSCTFGVLPKTLASHQCLEVFPLELIIVVILQFMV